MFYVEPFSPRNFFHVTMQTRKRKIRKRNVDEVILEFVLEMNQRVNEQGLTKLTVLCAETTETEKFRLDNWLPLMN